MSYIIIWEILIIKKLKNMDKHFKNLRVKNAMLNKESRKSLTKIDEQIKLTYMFLTYTSEELRVGGN